MTALDRAIIKAYHRPKSRSGPEPAGSPRAPHFAVGPAVPLSQALAELAAVPAAAAAVVVAEPAGGAETLVIEKTAAPVGPSIAAMLDAAVRPDATQSETIDVMAASSFALAALPEETVAVSPPAAETEWQPLLQVDRVVWPSLHARLEKAAPAAVEQLSLNLAALCGSGAKIVGFASCTRGEGVTTMLLAAARKFLGQGRRVAVVDAHWNNPQLAASLGLLPQVGWEETLACGLPLEEVVIEALEDHLAVLPVRELAPIAVQGNKISESLKTLARQFDVVLVDLGTLGGEEDCLGLNGAAAHVDAVVLVQNVRVTPPSQLAGARQRLAAANVRHAGSIQNFVSG